ncbi:MAG: AMP-binding protein [Acidaminococcaceae bacterium]|jgi:D-alanine--poly(phosphoribitol) ligase subunit 1|nr:AMP-binding protein [Acidaminococcaceae bacterium]
MWILDRLQAWQEKTKIALRYGTDSLTFKELWSQSEALAAFLETKYPEMLRQKTPLVLYGAKELALVPAMHAALKCGVPYVPVDTLYPVDRLRQIISQVEAKVIINLSACQLQGNFEVLDGRALQQIFTDYAGHTSNTDHWVQDRDVCYMLFTSGSTGQPKGVQICKENLLCFVNWYRDFCPVTEETVALNQVSYSFDVSVIPLYIYLAQGATLFNVGHAELEDFKLLETALGASRLTDWVSTPALFDICLFAKNFNQQLLPRLKRFTFAGEVLTKTLVRELQNRFGREAVVINGYGPTETTVLLTACVVTAAMLAAPESIPIGRLNPALGHKLDQGELLVWGGSIGAGYFKNPEQTAKNFFTAPDGKRGYRTGDLVTEREGLLYYQDRKDFQLKLNGYRIEPDDISSNINKLDSVQHSLVLPVTKDGKVAYLAAFVQLKPGCSQGSSLKDAIAVKKFLKTVVPVYMIPKKIVLVAQFPTNVNGKVDRKKLLEGLS